MGRTSENKKEKILSSFHRLGHPRNRNGTRRTVKHVPFLEIFAFALPFLLFCFLFFFSLVFFPYPANSWGRKEGSFCLEPAPQRNTNYADEKFTTFHRPSPFSHRPPDLNQTNHCPTSNKRVLHYFHGPVPYFPQDVEGPLSSPFLSFLFLFFTLAVFFAAGYPRLGFPLVLDLSYVAFRSRAAENSNRTSLQRESIPRSSRREGN